jgi:hypothetical protein
MKRSVARRARGSGLVPLTREDALALRVSRHHLDRRAPTGRWLQVTSEIGGLQAQSLSAAKLALWARVEKVSSASIDDALLHQRTIVKLYAMRGTVHLLAAEDCALYLAGLRLARRGDTLRGRGLSPKIIDEAREHAALILSAEPVTLKELEARVPAELRRKLTSSGPYPWHALVKDLLDSIAVCFGPPRGREVTFVRADRWLSPGPRDLPADDGERELGRRYLRAFAPATEADFAYWSGHTAATARRVFDALRDELAEVSVDGQTAWILSGDLRRLDTLASAASVRLLPSFDTYLLGHEDKTRFLDPVHHKKVFPGAGRVEPTILSNGRVVGTWVAKRSGDGVVVRLDPFAKLPRAAREAVEAEAARLVPFLEAA